MKKVLILVVLFVLAGCSITDTSRVYYILDNTCDSVMLEVLKEGGESATSTQTTTPTTDISVPLVGK